MVIFAEVAENDRIIDRHLRDIHPLLDYDASESVYDFLVVTTNLHPISHRFEVIEGGGSLWPNISSRRGRPPPTICTPIDRLVYMPYNFAAESFYTKKFCSRLSSRKAQFFIRTMEKIAFEAPLGVRSNVRCSS